MTLNDGEISLTICALLERVLHRLLGGVARGVAAEVEQLERGRRAAREGVAQVAHPVVADLVAVEVEHREGLERALRVRVLERRGESARLVVAGSSQAPRSPSFVAIFSASAPSKS